MRCTDCVSLGSAASEAFSSWQAREAEYEAEQEKIRKEKEKEIARLRALQEKAQDYRAEQVELLSCSSPLPLPLPLSFVHPTPGSHTLAACKVACRVEVQKRGCLLSSLQNLTADKCHLITGDLFWKMHLRRKDGPFPIAHGSSERAELCA